MKRLSTLLLFFIACLGVFAQPTNKVIISFNHKAGADSLVLNKTDFTIWNGKKTRLSRAQFYIAEIALQKNDNTFVPLTDQVLLVNANAPAAEFDLGQWPVEAVKGVVLHLGVDTAHNHLDPAVYPAGHPLALQNPSMHWGWAAGYRFMALEGKVDNNKDGAPEAYFELHNLGDSLYQTVSLSGNAIAQNGTLHLYFDLDYTKLFEDIPMAGDLIGHGSQPLNDSIMTNAATKGFISMNPTSAVPTVVSNSRNIKVFPNPADTETQITYTLPAGTAPLVVLTNMLGQPVHTVSGLPAEGLLRVATSSLPAGLYQCRFYNDRILLAQKPFIIHH